MLKDLSLLMVFASFDIAYSLKPPRLPKVYLPGQKFSLPPICSIATEWQDVPLCLQILSDFNGPIPDKSGYISLMNLIKFILIKEEMSCDNMSILLPQKQGKLSNAVSTLQNSQILTKIDTALKRKPVKVLKAVEINDHIDVPNMIPIMRPRGNRRRGKIGVPADAIKSNSTCEAPKAVKSQNGLTLIGFKPITSILGPNVPCQCAKCPPILNLASIQPKERCMQCQRLPTTNIKPIILGCGQNCHQCQKLTSPVFSGCPMISPVILAGCPKMATSGIRTGYSGFPGCSGGSSCSQAKSALSLFKSETIPLMNCYGNMLKKATTTVLVPYFISKLGM